MNYSQYLEQHQQLTNQLEQASKEFEDLRAKYDSASPEVRSELEPELKESMNQVEAAQTALSSLEYQNPEYEQERKDPLVYGDTKLDQNWQEHWQNHSDPVIEERFETALDSYQQAGYTDEQALQHMKGTNFNREVEVVTIQPGEVLTQYQVPESNKVGNYFTQESNASELGIEGLSIASQNRKPECYLVNQEIQALKSTSADLQNWRGNSELFYGEGTQYFIAKEDLSSLTKVFEQKPLENQETLMSEWSQDISSGIANTDNDLATIVNEANQNLYTKLTGESYEGTSEELSHALTEQLEESFGVECKEKFEQSYENSGLQLENQQQQEQEQSQGISY